MRRATSDNWVARYLLIGSLFAFILLFLVFPVIVIIIEATHILRSKKNFPASLVTTSPLGYVPPGNGVAKHFGAGDQKEHFAHYLTDADYQNFQRLGVRFIRLCISPDAIYSNGKPSARSMVAAVTPPNGPTNAQ